MYSPPQDIDSLLFDLIWVSSFVEPDMKFVPVDPDGQTNSCCRRLELPTLNYNASTSHAKCRSVCCRPLLKYFTNDKHVSPLCREETR